MFKSAMLALTALLLVAGCGKSGAGGAAGRYLAETVSRGDVEKSVLSTGVLQPFEVINVGAQATGQVLELKVALGDTVRRGQLLAVIDPTFQMNTLRNAQAALAAQEAQKNVQQAMQARDDLALDRTRSLVARGYAAKAAQDEAVAKVAIARAGVRTTEAQIRQASIAVDNARADLARTNVVAPMDGVVASILVREGQSVNAVQMSPTLLRLAKLDVMTVKAQVSEADVVNVRPGQKVYFTILGNPGRRYYATLRNVEPAPDNANDALVAPANTAIYYNALFDVPNPDGELRSSMTVQVSIVLGEAHGVLTAPIGALGKQSADGRYRVMVLDSAGKASERLVTVGVRGAAKFQVLGGLKAGDRVVVADAWNASVSGIAPEQKKK